MLLLLTVALVAMADPFHILAALVAAFLTRFDSWGRSLVAALVVGALAALLGYVLRASAGAPVYAYSIFGTFLGVAVETLIFAALWRGVRTGARLSDLGGRNGPS